MYLSLEVNMSEKERVVFGVFLLQPNKSKIMILKVPSSLKSKSTIHGFAFSPLKCSRYHPSLSNDRK